MRPAAEPSGRLRALAAIALAGAVATSCGGGGSGGGGITPGGDEDFGCDGRCAQQGLEVADVERVIAQGVAQAQAMGVAATIAVTDRVGNVLAVFAMPGAPATTTITACPGDPAQSCADGIPTGGLQGLEVPSAVAVISKAGTASYLSSQGNAFTTRTASQIVQSHFNPLERRQPGGPLFGVQFSQLPCGDLVTRSPANQGTGPNRLPLGLSADPGAVPLYKPSTGPGLSGAVPVGGVAAEFDGEYTLDPDIFDNDVSPEELVATAAASGYAAPSSRRADRISVIGRSLRFTDAEADPPSDVQPFAGLPGSLVAVGGFYDPPVVRAGQVLGTAQSGILSTTFDGQPAEVLVSPDGAVRYPPRSAPEPGGLTAAEVSSILGNALELIARTRAQIRQPLGTSAQVTVSVVGLGGEVLGQVRSPDAPVFGIDVSLQKARTALFFSARTAADQLLGAGTVAYPDGTTSSIPDYVTSVRTFLGIPDALTGTIAFSDRGGGNLSRPFFPDGIDGRPNGPFSKPAGQWSPFNTGLQLDLVFNGIASAALLGLPAQSCSLTDPTDPASVAIAQIPNGTQIFAGSVPVYRGSQLAGAVGVSGDGIDQDDMISFLSVHQASVDLGTIQNAPKEIRSDQIAVDGAHLRFVNCPVQPFLDSDRQGACDGL